MKIPVARKDADTQKIASWTCHVRMMLKGRIAEKSMPKNPSGSAR